VTYHDQLVNFTNRIHPRARGGASKNPNFWNILYSHTKTVERTAA